MGGSESEEEEECYRPPIVERSDDTSQDQLKIEAPLGDCLDLSRWRESHAIHCDITGFTSRPRAVEQAMRALRHQFDFQVTCKAMQPCINAEMFEEYIRTVFLPNLDELRSLEEFAAEDAI
jgi:hypothetical protein